MAISDRLNALTPHGGHTGARLRAGWLGRQLSREVGVREATVQLMVSFVLSAVFGSVQQVLFNAQFGTGAEASAFYAALRLRDLFFALIAGRVVSSAVIPVLASAAQHEESRNRWRLTDLVLTSLLATMAVLVVLCQILAPAIVSNILAPGFPPETSGLTVRLVRIVLIQPLVLAVSALAIAVLNSRNQFLLTAVSLVCHNVGLVGGVLAARLLPELGIFGPTLGVVAGSVLQFCVLLPGLRKLNFRYQPRWNWRDEHFQQVVRLIVPIALSAGFGYLAFVIDTAFASVAREPQAVPAIFNAWLLVTLPISLLGKAVAQSVFPRLARHAAAQDWMALRRTLRRALLGSAGLSVPFLLGFIVVGRWIIHVLFEHGRFDAAAGSLTYAVLAVYALSIPAYVGAEVIVRGLIAVRDTRTPLLTDAVQLIARAGLMALLVSRLGVVAIPATVAATASLETLVLALALHLRIRQRTTTPATAAAVPGG